MKLKDYVNKGIYQNKAIPTDAPYTTWNILRKKFVADKDYIDIIPTDNGNFKATIDNNRRVMVNTYTELSIDLINRINNSPDGIAIYETNDEKYRFAFIPRETYI